MIDEWIVKTFQYILCKLLHFIFRKIQCFHQFIKHHFVDVLADYFMLTSITYNIDTRQVRYRRKNSMRAIEQCYFAFVIRSFRRYEQYIQSCLISREFFSHFLRSFNYPQMEDFSLYNKVIVILYLFFDSIDILAGESRNDTVYQRCIYSASFFKPSFEFIAKIPQVDILIDRFLQLVTIQENKFAREDYQSLGLVAIKRFETVIQQLSQFAGIR